MKASTGIGFHSYPCRRSGFSSSSQSFCFTMDTVQGVLCVALDRPIREARSNEVF